MIKGNLPTSKQRNKYLAGDGSASGGGILFQWNNTALPTLNSVDRAIGWQGTDLKKWTGSGWVLISGGGGGDTWDSIYAGDKSLSISGDTLSFNLTHATNDGLTLTGSGGSAGQVLQITNSGSGDDVQGTSDTWAVTKAGVATFVGIDGCDALTAAAALTLEATGANIITIGGTSSGAIGIGAGGGAVTVTSALTASAGITLTAGGMLSSDGIVDVVDNSNAASSLRVTNDTLTTYGNASDAGMIVFRSESLTTAALLHLSLDETNQAGGFFLRAWSQDAGASAFTIGELGATVIAGSASGTDALTLTAGDITVTAGDVTLTEGSVVVTNTANETAVTVVADSVTSGIVIDVNADGVTSGTVLHLDTTAATFSGLYIDCYDGAASDFSVGLYGATIIAGNATGTDALTLTNGDITVTSGDVTLTAGDAVLTEGSISLTNTANETVVTVVADSVTSGIVIDVNADAVTTGTILHLDTSLATFTGKYLDCFDGVASDFSIGLAGATVVAGTASGTDVLTLTAGDVTVTSGDITISEGSAVIVNTADQAALTITADSVASANVVDINADGLTDGTILHLDTTVAALTTGLYIDCFDGAASDFSVAKFGATVIAGNATGTDALTLTAGDVTLTNGDATLTDGDLILTANSSLITFTGTGTNGGVITNLYNDSPTTLSGSQKDIKILIGATPYYFTVYPTKA